MPDFAPPRRLRLPLLVLCCLVLAACAEYRPRISYDYDPLADFTLLRQFAWAEPATPRRPDDPWVNNSLVDDRIKAVIEHQLLLKGIRRAEGGPADFLVAYQVVTRKHAMGQLAPYPYGPFYPYYGMGFDYSYGPWYYDAWGIPGGYWQEYETHSLVVDFLNPATHRQIWRGVLHDAVDFSGDPGTQKYRLDAQVRYLFGDFPPGTRPSE